MSKGRYHVTATGGGDLPDVDYFTDEYPSDVLGRYQCVDVLLTETLPLSKFKEALDAAAPFKVTR